MNLVLNVCTIDMEPGDRNSSWVCCTFVNNELNIPPFLCPIRNSFCISVPDMLTAQHIYIIRSFL
jgi:hypothetical protein